MKHDSPNIELSMRNLCKYIPDVPHIMHCLSARLGILIIRHYHCRLADTNIGEIRTLFIEIEKVSMRGKGLRRNIANLNIFSSFSFHCLFSNLVPSEQSKRVSAEPAGVMKFSQDTKGALR